MAGPDPDVAGLLAWAKDKGIVLHPALAVRGRTLTATADIEPGVCLSIPAPCLLTAALARAHRDYGPAFAALAAPLPDRDALCLVLLAEACAGEASPWAPYIAALPKKYDDPTWWCPADAALLAGSRLGASADAAWAHVLRLTAAANALEDARIASGAGRGPLSDAAAVRAVDAPAAAALDAAAAARGWARPPGQPRLPWGLSPAGAAWARSTVWSRAFNLPPVGSGAAALLPVADLMDHDPRVPVAWWLDGAGRGGAPTFTWAARARVPAGTPLLMNYSPFKSTEELVAGYGFALRGGNPADFFHVALGVQGGGAAAARAAALLRAAGLPRDVFMRAGDPLPASALAAAALALAHPAAAAGLEAALGRGGAAGTAQPPEAAAHAPTVEVGPRPPAHAGPPPRRPPTPDPTRAACDMGVPATPATQLAAVQSLRAALRARAGQLGGGGNAAGAAVSVASLAAAAGADDAAAAAAAAAGRHHAAMAHSYLAGQRRLAGAALERLEGWAAAVVAAAAGAAASLGLVGPPGRGGPSTTTCCEVGVPTAPGSSLEARWAWGLRTPAGAPTPAGSVLADVPAAEVIAFPGREAAVGALAAAAEALGLVPPGAAATVATSPHPAIPDLTARHLFCAVPPPPAVSVLMGGGPEASAAPALQGTPAGDALAADLAANDGLPAAATLALAWAGAVVDRVAWPGPGGVGLALVRTAWAVPPALRGVAADLEWRVDGTAAAATLVAACALPPATDLSRALELPGAPAGDVIVEFGPAALARLAAAPPPGALHPTLGGPDPALHAFEVDVAPAGEEEDGGGGPVTALLEAAGLSGPHWLAGGSGAAGRARRLVEALAVMGGAAASSAGPGALLEKAGAARLLAARAAAADAWDRVAESGGAGRDDAIKADAAADAAAGAFVAGVLAGTGAAERAARAARGVLRGEREALANGGGAGGDSDADPAARGAAVYRAGLITALDAALAEVGAALKAAKREGKGGGGEAKKRARQR